MSGDELLKKMVSGTDLPQELLSQELRELLARASVAPESCSLDDLRIILAEYAQDVLLEAKRSYSK